MLTERDLFEVDHCAEGAYLSEEWNFPDVIIEAIATHHDPPGKGSSLSNLLRVAWRLADVLGFAALPPDKPFSYGELLALIPLTRSSWLSETVDEVREEVNARLEGVPK